jgi:hypothetical protein
MASILLDSCVWGGALPVLLELGHDVDWSGSWEQDPGDAAILDRAHSFEKTSSNWIRILASSPFSKECPIMASSG